MISPARNDAFAMGDHTPDARVTTYADRMREAQLGRERENTMQVGPLANNLRCQQLLSMSCLTAFGSSFYWCSF